MSVRNDSMIGVPIHNGDKHIADIVKKSKQYGDVVVYDDGSTDKTRSEALNAGAQVLTTQGRSKGYGVALQSLFEYARHRYDYLVILDGDGKYDPSEIPTFLSAIKEADIVVGYRHLPDTEIPTHREVAGAGESDCRFRAYNKKAIQSINITEDGYSASVEILRKAKEQGLRIVVLPCTMVYEEGHLTGRTAHITSLIEKVFWEVIWFNPFTVLGIPAIISFMCSLYFGVYLVYFFIRSKYCVLSYAFFMFGFLQLSLILCISMLFVIALRRVLKGSNNTNPPGRDTT